MCGGASALIYDDDEGPVYCCEDGQRVIQMHFLTLASLALTPGPAQMDDDDGHRTVLRTEP